jgi:hypothetical protein
VCFESVSTGLDRQVSTAAAGPGPLGSDDDGDEYEGTDGEEDEDGEEEEDPLALVYAVRLKGPPRALNVVWENEGGGGGGTGNAEGRGGGRGAAPPPPGGGRAQLLCAVEQQWWYRGL